MNQWDFSDSGIVLEDEEDVRRRPRRSFLWGALLVLLPWLLALAFMVSRPATEPIIHEVPKTARAK